MRILVLKLQILTYSLGILIDRREKINVDGIDKNSNC